MTDEDGRGDALDASPADPENSSMLLAASGIAALVLAATAALLPVPYVVQAPGPVVDTLGSVDGRPLIQIEGTTTYPTEGQLDLTTVSVSGGPGSTINLFEVLRGWVDPTEAVVPREAVFPTGVSEEQIDERNTAQMETSQEQATVAALTTLGIEIPTDLVVGGFSEGAPAAASLQVGDQVTGVNGTPVADLAALRDALGTVEPGDDVTLQLLREGEEVDVDATTLPEAGEQGQVQLGIVVDPGYEFPFDVSISIDDIGGPSAGTMFALGIIDTLTPGASTGGEHIAGTGTIDATGTVGSIGGLPQKLVGARGVGADWFLAPAGNCDDALNPPDGLRVVPIATLDEARDAVETIASGEGTDDLATCS